MRRSLHVWIEPPRLENGSTVYAARLEARGAATRALWLRVPQELAPEVTERADPFAILSVFTAMKSRLPTVVHGEVSPSLLRNLDEFQAAWANWRPEEYGHVDLSADVEREDPHPAPADRAVIAFSGGIDAAFSAWRHREQRCGRRGRDVAAAMMIHGYDVPAREQAMFDGAYRRTRTMAQALGLPLIPVATNYREFEPHWEDVHGAGVVACLALFARSYGTGIVAGGEPYRTLVLPWGSNPMTDPLLASKSFAVVHDGAEFDRVAKIRALSEQPAVMDNLLVCWEPTADGGNCGRCVKCIRTLLDFRVLGLPRPRAFARDVNAADVRALSIDVLSEGNVHEFELVLRAAAAADIDEPWIAPLRRRVARYRVRARIGGTRVVAALRKALMARPSGQRMWRLLAGR